MNGLRSQVLSCFRNMHRTRMEIFKGDVEMLEALRGEINKKFREHQQLDDEHKIQNLLEAADQTATYLKHNVVQLVETKENTCEVQVRPDLLFEDVPYREMPDDVLKNYKKKPKCSDKP